MKRLMSGAILLGAAFAAAACNNVTDSLSGTATLIVATPTFLIVDTVSTEAVLVQTFDDQGSPMEGAATVGTITGPFTAIVDTSYRPGGLPVVTQLLVGATGLARGTFQTSANGLTTTVTVVSAPPVDNYVGSVNDTLPFVDDILTFTMQAGQPYRFTSASQAYIGPVSVPASLMTLISIAPDSLSATFSVDAVQTGIATIDGAILSYAPTIGTFNVSTVDTVRVQ